MTMYTIMQVMITGEEEWEDSGWSDGLVLGVLASQSLGSGSILQTKVYPSTISSLNCVSKKSLSIVIFEV